MSRRHVYAEVTPEPNGRWRIEVGVSEMRHSLIQDVYDLPTWAVDNGARNERSACRKANRMIRRVRRAVTAAEEREAFVVEEHDQ